MNERRDEMKTYNPTTQNSSENLDWLIECFKTACEETLFRLKQRDRYFILQLIVQVVIFAIWKKIKLFGIEATGNQPDILILAVPVSLVFAVLYFIEDGHIGQLSKYVARLSHVESQITRRPIINNWDRSPELKKYARTHLLIIKFLTQLIAFVVAPLLLVGIYFSTADPKWQPEWLIIADIVMCILIIALTISGFIHRLKAGAQVEPPEEWK